MHPSDIKIGQIELSVSEIVEMIENGHIELETDYRTWDIYGMSMSIESILLGLTMTPIYVDATNPEKWLVLDGTKRLKALVKFIAGKFILKDLELLKEYSNSSYNNLPKTIQRRLVQSKFTIYSINQGVPPEVRLSLIRRIVPDIKNGLSLNIRESLMSIKAKVLIDHLTSNYLYQLTLNKAKAKNALELEVKYLQTLYWHFENDIFTRFYHNAKTEDIIILTNIYAKEKDMFIIDIWEKGLIRVFELFDNYAFKTGPQTKYINKYVFDSLILYFGTIITNNAYNQLKHNKDKFLHLWFELFHNETGKKIFRRIPPNTKIEELFRLTEQSIAS